jgi:acyl-CoA reductase-like NAD-dependent aldehyde dehydrogenase
MASDVTESTTSTPSSDTINLTAMDLSRGFYNIINGERYSTSETVEVINPSTGEVLASLPDVDQNGLNRAVEAARAAFPAWMSTSYGSRQALLRRFVQVVASHYDELCALLTAEHGRPTAAAEWEIGGFIKLFGPAGADMELSDAGSLDEVMGEATVRYIPLGVICAISPWNLPVILALAKVIPALLTGNTVVLKPSPYAPLTVLRIVDYARDLFPAGVFNVITGGDALGPLMTSHPAFDAVSFTGSTVTGKKVLGSAAANLTHVTAELGGNDAAIVLDDADPEEIAPALFWGLFFLSGQLCVGLKRLFVPESLYPRLTKALVAYAKTITVGDGFKANTALGPVQNRLQYDRLRATERDIERLKAKILFRGDVPEEWAGLFIPVTLLDDPSDDWPFVSDEVFGPIRSVLKYKDLNDAVRRANSTSYGLGASVWGRDPETLNTVALQMEAGTVWINQHSILSPKYPYGGHKDSGIGIQWGIQGLKAFCNIQVISAKR